MMSAAADGSRQSTSSVQNKKRTHPTYFDELNPDLASVLRFEARKDVGERGSRFEEVFWRAPGDGSGEVVPLCIGC